MKNDGQCWIHVPTDLTDPALSESAAQLVNGLRALYDLPELAAGDANPYYLQIIRIGIASGASIEIVNGMSACGPVTKVDRIPLALADDILAVGGDIEGFPLFIRLTDINAICPFGDGVETWATWGTVGESHKPVQYGTFWYRSTAVGVQGTLMNVSQLEPVRQQLITLSQFKTIQAEFA